jgi:hypothetical protein
LAKSKEKKGHYNMVIVELHEDHKPKEEVHVWVVTQGGICTRVVLEQEEFSWYNIEGKIIKTV